MATDPITTEVIANALKSLVYEMDAAIERTSMSIIIREQHDFGMSLVDHRGWVVAGTSFAGQTLAEYAGAHPVEPGDVVMFNDPYLSHGEISHLGDTMIAVPIFWDGGLIAWGIAWGHHMDIGADAPAAMPTQATEIFHEGLQIPPVKLYERGALNQGVLDIVARNSRTPEMMVGDTLALSAAGKIAEKRLHELCGKFGGAAVLETFQVLFDRAHDTMLKLIHQLPDGRPVSFSDVLDGDGINDEPLTIKLTIERQGDRVVLDFAGTSPQCEGPMNLPLNPGLQKLRFYNVMRLAAGARINIDPALDANQGVEDLIEVRIPEGCFLAPTYPAPVSLRHLTGGRNGEVTQGILAQLFPDTIPATANGSLNSYSLLGVGRKPEDRWLCFEVTAAGGGGRPFGDGIDAYCFNNRLKNAPVEFVETVYPVRVEQYSLRPGSSGAGKHRGGYGLIRAIRSLKPAKLTFLDERQRTQPWGLRGGRPAAANDAYVERADGRIVMLPGKFDHLPIAPGDMFVMRTGGGGGWGNPAERDPELVRRDVERRLLTPEQARERYGVVVDGWPPRIDADATAALRAAMPVPAELFDRGVPVASPGPGEYRELPEPPVPWLVIEQPVAAGLAGRDDD
ncbi:MAG TPA: hydantoinase B/oxoprolinase family protein [Thermomicrobiaceae bacterium]|nr:hydantoinase B/oxoprolinase family protein [Thermomicrobiaceae bacterium]